MPAGVAPGLGKLNRTHAVIVPSGHAAYVIGLASCLQPKGIFTWRQQAAPDAVGQGRGALPMMSQRGTYQVLPFTAKHVDVDSHLHIADAVSVKNDRQLVANMWTAVNATLHKGTYDVERVGVAAFKGKQYQDGVCTPVAYKTIDGRVAGLRIVESYAFCLFLRLRFLAAGSSQQHHGRSQQKCFLHRSYPFTFSLFYTFRVQKYKE